MLFAEDLNFLVTNRLPRRFATVLFGRLSRIRSRPLTAFVVALWRAFADDLCLEESKHQRFDSLHDCFTRELRDDARKIDPTPNFIVSPCDAIVGAHGRIRSGEAIQAKGFPYRLSELLPDPTLVERHQEGYFCTLRLKASMYHHFHAPVDGSLREVLYVSGDTWNVNPIALKRVERLFCKNERAALAFEQLEPGLEITLVPVAAILVAGIRLHCLPEVLDLQYEGPHRIACHADYRRGDPMGYFQHGSTILVFVRGDVEFADGVRSGERINMGQPLFRHLSSPLVPAAPAPQQRAQAPALS